MRFKCVHLIFDNMNQLETPVPVKLYGTKYIKGLLFQLVL